MAGPSLPRQLPPQCASAIRRNNSSSKPPLKTYSKRALQDTSQPSHKRQRIEHPTKPVETTIRSGVPPCTPTLPKKRSISEYFKPVTHPSTPSSPQSSIFSSDPIQKNVESPPSSPPSPHISPFVALRKTRIRRRLTSRPPLGVIKMSDINAGGSKEHRKGNSKRVAEMGPFFPGSPLRTPYLTKTSPPGLRQAARGGTSSEEEEGESDEGDQARHGGNHIPRSEPIDIPGPRVGTLNEPIIPFAPQRPYMFRGQRFQPSNATPANQQTTFSSADTLAEDSTPGSQMTAGSTDTLVADPCTRRQTAFSQQDIEDFERTEMLHTTQSGEQDLPFGMGDNITDPNYIRVPGAELINVVSPSGAAPQSTENPTQIAASQMDPGASVQSNITGPSVPQASASSVGAGIIPTNISTPDNVAQDSGNLVQAQLDLGQPTNLTCDTCRFTFNHTVQADVKAHRKFHDCHILGEPVVGLTTTPRYLLRSIDTGIGQGDSIVMVDRSSTEGWKNLAMTVLERHVDRELGAAPISQSHLWSSIKDPATTGRSSEANLVDRYKVYMYVRRYQPKLGKLGRVVSLLLAERIATGFETNRIQVESDEFGPWPAQVPHFQIVVSTKAHEAVLGINKFWTLGTSRRRGYAKKLLDQARQSFIPSYVIPRVHIAWTFTTDDGAHFAKEYLQSQTDYDNLTYDDQM